MFVLNPLFAWLQRPGWTDRVNLKICVEDEDYISVRSGYERYMSSTEKFMILLFSINADWDEYPIASLQRHLNAQFPLDVISTK